MLPIKTRQHFKQKQALWDNIGKSERKQINLNGLQPHDSCSSARRFLNLTYFQAFANGPAFVISDIHCFGVDRRDSSEANYDRAAALFSYDREARGDQKYNLTFSLANHHANHELTSL